MRRLPTLEVGAIVGGDFRVVRPIGEGGMGAVYEVEQLSTGRRRAFKVMHPEHAPDAASVRRFVEEAKTSGRIESEHVVEVVSAGVDGQVPWIALELLDGEDLSQTLEREGTLPLPVVREIVRQVGHALRAAHRIGIVHRDLKPENIFVARARRVSQDLTVKVLDFGIAKTLAQNQTAATATSAIGSPLFMSPEQASPGAQIRASTDVWPMGLIAFAALTGKSYWLAANGAQFNLQALLAEVLVHPMVSASQRAQELGVSAPLPKGFDAWFARCVARDPAQRFAEAGACTDAFVSLSESGGQPAPSSSVARTQAMPPNANVGGFAPARIAPAPQSFGGFPPGPTPNGAPVPQAFPREAPLAGARQGMSYAEPKRGRVGLAVLAVVVGLAVMSICGIGGIAFLSQRSTESREVAVTGPVVRTTPAEPAAPLGDVPPQSAPPTRGPAPSQPAADGPTGQLMVNSRPWSTVTVDGRRVGNTPVRLDLAPGRHTVRIETEDGRSHSEEVTIAEGDNTPIIYSFGPGDEDPAEVERRPETPSRQDIVGAMRSVQPAVQACSDGGHGVASVRAVFEGATGQVQGVTVTGSFSGEVRECIAQAVRGARVPAFRRSSFSVNYPFRL